MKDRGEQLQIAGNQRSARTVVSKPFLNPGVELVFGPIGGAFEDRPKPGPWTPSEHLPSVFDDRGLAIGLWSNIPKSNRHNSAG
jgi:hypothetical protein